MDGIGTVGTFLEGRPKTSMEGSQLMWYSFSAQRGAG